MRGTSLALLTLMVGCSSPTPSTVLGQWGGQEASVILTKSGGSVSYPCGAGTIDSAWTVTEDGQFSASGGHSFGGGPVPPGGNPPHPAEYRGQIDGDSFEMTVVITDLQQTLGPFHLIRGGPIVHELCE